MEETGRAEPVHFHLNRIVYQSRDGNLNIKGTEQVQPVHLLS